MKITTLRTGYSVPQHCIIKRTALITRDQTPQEAEFYSSPVVDDLIVSKCGNDAIISTQALAFFEAKVYMRHLFGATDI